ncbi:MAG TPA: M20/M25/M40 family metallo-hydrolase [Terracidiphilus sp.]|jgi:acetylornithine deacetylase/succinyl-diaminopimelate desuccinylase-like protein|nr:M20/M25/M40 family metallo-hydrolase [Terracidiphilus sp.]
MPLLTRKTAFSRVTAIAARRAVHAAFAWMHNNPRTIMDWQARLVAIPAPPFGESARATVIAEIFANIGLGDIATDSIGNVTALIPAAHLPAESTGPVIALSAHLDTVFPAATPIHPIVVREDAVLRLTAPGACDNGAGLAALVALAQAIIHAQVELPVPLVILANVGEEGEGDLRGVRHFYQSSPYAGRVAAHVVLDGAGADSAVTQAVGSRRFQVTVTGPGGHSFTDAGTPNPIAALAAALAVVAETPLSIEPRSTLNLGTIHGGTSVNSIPESVSASIDFRSTSPDELVRLEVALHRAVEDAIDRANTHAQPTRSRGALGFSIDKIGDRPAAQLPNDAPLLETLRAVDRHLNLRTDLRLGSTDANIPIARGLQAISMGAGGEGGGAHTLAEWYTDKDRELGLRRILLLLLAAAEWAAEQ